MHRLVLLASILLVLGFVAPASAQQNPLNAVVTVESSVPPDARTAGSLGTERLGGGVMIDSDGLILTIGYLVMESTEIWVSDSDANRVPAEMVAYDHETGFGLIRALGPLSSQPVRLGKPAEIEVGDTLLAAGPGLARPTVILAKESFAGGWEYLLDSALYTSPPIPNFGGAALFAQDGRLIGIGSLVLGDAAGSGLPGNMYVPIDLLPPILGDLLAYGRSTSPAKPWIGVYPNEVDGALVVGRVARGGPAESAGIGPGDVILGVGEEPVDDMDALWRKVRSLGDAGVEVPLKVLTPSGVRDVVLTSRDRRTWLRLQRSY